MKENGIDIAIVRSDEDYEDMKNVRREVFVKEYNIPESLEFDGNDHSATHIIARRGDQPIGTMRVRYFSDFVKFERMAVIDEYRKMNGENIADLIMKKGMEFASQKGYRKIYGLCKKELLPRWQKCGYRPIEDVPNVQQNGMILIPIIRDLPKHPQSISFSSHPDLLNAVEDRWDEVVCQKQLLDSPDHKNSLSFIIRLKAKIRKTMTV